ncbi:VUT family protein [Propioniciclava tarda]|uniref:Probable queuosine precursor transporter n=1 Tax=Propioniciclava tarda TaxID=433330 RepID=A0A4Q9KIG3_PROTD|nr:VUT family protein [Propioniciclava tarda]
MQRGCSHRPPVKRRRGLRTLRCTLVTAAGASTPVSQDQPRFASGSRGMFDIVVATFCGLLLISNVGATKLIEFQPVPVLGSLVTDGGALLFPLTYVIGDVLAEVYGMARARRAIVLGFVLAFVMSVSFLIVDAAPPASDWPNQAAWSAVLGFVPRIVIASLAGYLVGQLLNAWVLVRIKQRTGERALSVRLMTSTVVGEFADTLVFCSVAFGPLGMWLGGGSIPLDTLLNYTLVGWVYKCVVEFVCLPVTQVVIASVKRREPGYWR